VLVPLLVDKDNVGPSGLKAITGMMTMRPTPDFNASPLLNPLLICTLLVILDGASGSLCCAHHNSTA
jgi:hypothetical protein